MSALTQNLSHCPRCNAALAAADMKCGVCRYTGIENVDFLDISDQQEYKKTLEFQRAAWRSFDESLREQLLEFDKGWPRVENFDKIWKCLRLKADAVGFDKRATNQRASVVWNELIKQPPPEVDEPPRKPPPADPHHEAVRQWVRFLPDGEVDVEVWEKFLQTLDEPVDDLYLEKFRDAEIKRQFAEFQITHSDALGNLRLGDRRRVKRFVEMLGDGCELIMLPIPRGEFQMGSERYAWEQPIHRVRIAGFYLSQHAITQAQWRTVARWPKVNIDIAEQFFAFVGDDLPVDSVSWAEAMEFCARLRRQTGRHYRLPSEAEWEYACRAGSKSEFSFGEGISPVIANYDGTQPYGSSAPGDFRKATVGVGSMGAANGFGLYDMHGNVCEWCADDWHETYEGAPEDGSVWASGNGENRRVVRGGSWIHSAEICRSSDRSQEFANSDTKLFYMGLRVAGNL